MTNTHYVFLFILKLLMKDFLHGFLLCLETSLINTSESNNLESYNANHQWDLLSKWQHAGKTCLYFSPSDFTTRKVSTKYECCAEIFENMNVLIEIRRHSLYYVVNLIGIKRKARQIYRIWKPFTANMIHFQW